MDDIFGSGSGQEIDKATTTEKIVQMIEELSKREVRLEEWETMRRDSRRMQREDRRPNAFPRKNKTFPTKFGDSETQDREETLAFWRAKTTRK